jgi:hypothetical protein
LRKLLISLYNGLGNFLIKGEIKRLSSKPVEYPAGPFSGDNGKSLSYMSTTMYDEEQDIELNVKYVCSCDEYVYEMRVEGSFACIHCDSICKEKGCVICQALNDKDLWSDANL